MLRSRRTAPRSRSDERVPDPIVERLDGGHPEHEALLADSVGLALLVVLEQLSPAERLAFVLHDMFAVPFDEIAPMVERTPEAARQLASRARRRVQGAAPPPADRARQREVVDAFHAAARRGRLRRLVVRPASRRRAARWTSVPASRAAHHDGRGGRRQPGACCSAAARPLRHAPRRS